MESPYEYLHVGTLDAVGKKYYSRELYQHALQVRKLAIKLYGYVAPILELKPPCQDILSTAAFLHDIGHYVNQRKHDQHSDYLIQNEEDLDVLPVTLRTAVAVVAGGHRKRVSENLTGFHPDDQELLLKLTSILRIADALDYYHDDGLDFAGVENAKHGFTISIEGAGWERLLSRLGKKGLLMESLVGKKLHFIGRVPVSLPNPSSRG